MRILIDECVDPRVKQLFPGHQVSTVHELGWAALEDPALLKIANDRFDVFLTIDQGIEFQQNVSKLGLAVVIVHVSKNQFRNYAANPGEILQAIETARPGQISHVYCRR
jgi:predicted nuclease of predicted toxin-antitoxin system